MDHIRRSTVSSASHRTSQKTQLLSITKTPSRRWIINCVGVHAKCPLFLSDFNSNRNVCTNTTKNAGNVISANVRCESLCSTRADGRTQTHDASHRSFPQSFCQRAYRHHHNTKLTSHKQGIWMSLTLILLKWRIWWANNASKWQMGFNSAFKELIITR
jgi:hypothetical protein